MRTSTQFAWACCDAGNYPPPVPKKGSRYGPDAACWLCGGPTDGVGWHHKLGLSGTFCSHNIAVRPDSQTVCQSCVATSASDGWLQYASRYPERNLWTHFPEKDGGIKRQFNWLYASHLFRVGHHESPSRPRWRELLIEPPEPPFLMILAISGKKQLIFRGRISQSRESFWVQADEMRVLVRPNEFAECLAAFEALYDAGFSKDSIVSGNYHSGQLAKTGLSIWRPLEEAIRPFRQRHPEYLLLAHHCGQRTSIVDADSQPAPAPPVESATIIIQLPLPVPAGTQISLF
jgi:hypothetical protein